MRTQRLLASPEDTNAREWFPPHAIFVTVFPDRAPPTSVGTWTDELLARPT